MKVLDKLDELVVRGALGLLERALVQRGVIAPAPANPPKQRRRRRRKVEPKRDVVQGRVISSDDDSAKK